MNATANDGIVIVQQTPARSVVLLGDDEVCACYRATEGGWRCLSEHAISDWPTEMAALTEGMRLARAVLTARREVERQRALGNAQAARSWPK